MKLIEFLKKYRWLILIVCLAVYLVFAEGGIIHRRQVDKEIKLLKNELENQKRIIATLEEQNNRLFSEHQTDEEEFIRTHLFLKKDNEDVFRVNYQTTDEE